MPSASPIVAGECWPAVKTPSTSLILRPASRTALRTASRCSVSMALVGQRAQLVALVDADDADRVPELLHRGASRGLEQRQRDLVGELLEDDLDGHVARMRLGSGSMPTRFDIMRGPSSSSIMARTYGRLHLERLAEGLVGDLEGVELPAAARLHPLDVGGVAERAQHARIEERAPAVRGSGAASASARGGRPSRAWPPA